MIDHTSQPCHSRFRARTGGGALAEGRGRALCPASPLLRCTTSRSIAAIRPLVDMVPSSAPRNDQQLPVLPALALPRVKVSRRDHAAVVDGQTASSAWRHDVNRSICDAARCCWLGEFVPIETPGNCRQRPMILQRTSAHGLRWQRRSAGPLTIRRACIRLCLHACLRPMTNASNRRHLQMVPSSKQ